MQSLYQLSHQVSPDLIKVGSNLNDYCPRMGVDGDDWERLRDMQVKWMKAEIRLKQLLSRNAKDCGIN